MRTTLCNPNINPWRELDRLFAAATRTPRPPYSPHGSYLPASDLVELEDGYELRVELPGIKREQLQVQTQNSTISLRITPLEQQANKDDQKEVREIELRLPRFIQQERIEAKLEDGILTFKLPKSAQAQTREIQIS